MFDYRRVVANLFPCSCPWFAVDSSLIYLHFGGLLFRNGNLMLSRFCMILQQFKLQFFWGVYGIPYHTSSWFVALFFNCKNICFKADFPWATLWPTCRTCRLIAGPIGGISRQLGPDSAFVAFNFSGTPGAKRRAEPMDQLSEKIPPMCNDINIVLSCYIMFLQCKCRNKYWQIQYDVWSMQYDVCPIMMMILMVLMLMMMMMMVMMRIRMRRRRRRWWSWFMMMSLRIERGDACTIGHRPPASGHAKKNYPRCLWVYSNPSPVRRIRGPQFLPEDREPRGIGYFQDRALRIPIFG